MIKIKINSKLLITNVLAVFFQMTILGQNTTTGLSLSLEQATQYAIDNNRTLRNASLEVQKAKASQWQTLATMLPQANMTFDYQNYLGYESEISMGGLPMKIPMNPNGTLGIQASVTLSGAQIVGTTLKKIAIEMTNIQQQQSMQNIRSQVSQIYASILVMEKTQVLLDSSHSNLLRLSEITENAVKAGAIEQIDADQISIQVSSMLNRISASKRAIETCYNSLRLMLGVDINTPITLTDNIDKVINPQTAENLLQSDFNINNNFSYQLLMKNKELTKRQTIMAAMEYLPSITGFYQYTYKTYFGKEEGFNMTPPNVLGVNLSIPLWSSGARAAKVREAQIAEKIMENTISDTENALRTNDKQLRYDLASAMDEYENQKNNIDVTQRVFENMTNKFKYGTASSSDLTNASNNLIAAQSTYIQAMLNMLNAQIALENLLNN